MDNKLYSNKWVDIISFIVDIIIGITITYVTMMLFNQISKTSLFTYVFFVILMFSIYDFYTRTIRNKYELVLTVFLSIFISTVATGILSMIFKSVYFCYNIGYYFVLAILSFVAFSLDKYIFSKVIKSIEGAPKLLVIESDKVKNDLARKIKYSYSIVYEAWYEMIDVDDVSAADDIIKTKLPMFASIFISPNVPDELSYRIMSKALEMGKNIYILPDIYNISTLKSKMVQFDDTPALMIKPFSLTKWQKLVKRAFDLVFATICVVLTSPIMIACAVAIKLDSKGPIIFKQERLTINQKPFNIYKFRTMVNNAEKLTGAVLATDDDPRITKVGKFLRLTRLDEIPQIFNILFGSMTLVGPRPERKVFVDQYIKEIDNYEKRFSVKAGLTGLAQVYGKYQTRIKDKTLYDIMYIRNFSFVLDIKIMLLTVKVVFTKESSEGISTNLGYETEQHESSISDVVSSKDVK